MAPTVCHVDMDAFFVSVELLRRPQLRGKPVVVATGTDPGARGVVMAASYEARRYGVHSAMPLATAHRRCPQAVLIGRDLALYRRASGHVMEILRRFSDVVEIVGLDEAYLDLAASPAPKARARQLKRDVRAETGLVCSVGLAPNKLLAKIASDLEKPDGFTVLEPADMPGAVADRPATLIPGVGPKTARRLSRNGIRTVGELADAGPASLRSILGPRLGPELHARANGHDERLVEGRRERKSESRETTFSSDIEDAAILDATIDRLSESVCAGLASEGRLGRTVTLKVRLRPFRTYTRSRTLRSPTADPKVVGAVARGLLAAFDADAPVRLLGIGMSGLTRAAGHGELARAEHRPGAAEPQPLPGLGG